MMPCGVKTARPMAFRIARAAQYQISRSKGFISKTFMARLPEADRFISGRLSCSESASMHSTRKYFCHCQIRLF